MYANEKIDSTYRILQWPNKLKLSKHAVG